MLRTITCATFRHFIASETINLTPRRFAGHTKWQNIRHIKAAKDAARSTVFTKISRQIKVAIQEGGSSDVKKNLKLENVVEQARRANMPVATIQSVIKSCESDKSNSKPHLIEIKGPGGCIILCEVFTGNIHLLKQSIATLLRKHKGKCSDGGGLHLFQEKGIIEADITDINKEGLLEVATSVARQLFVRSTEKSVDLATLVATDHAIEAGAEDVKILEQEGTLQFVCGASNLRKVLSALEVHYKISSASVEFTPIKLQELGDDDLKLCANLYEKLEAMPEVVRLSDNIA